MPVDFDADTPYYQQIEDHARGAAGAEIATVDLALSWMKGFSLMRPPSHHATQTKTMGFCYLNSISIAGPSRSRNCCQRVAIWDFNAHHGNGTEASFWQPANQRVRFAFCSPIARLSGHRQIIARKCLQLAYPAKYGCRKACLGCSPAA